MKSREENKEIRRREENEEKKDNKEMERKERENIELVFPAIFERDGEYISVKFPDLSGCQTQGETFIEAFLAAQEALGLYLDGMEVLPKATEYEAVPEKTGTRVLLIQADMEDNIQYGEIDISQILATAAERKGYTKYRVAKILGKSESYVNRIFSGERKPAPDFAQQLCALLDLDWRMFYSAQSI